MPEGIKIWGKCLMATDGRGRRRIYLDGSPAESAHRSPALPALSAPLAPPPPPRQHHRPAHTDSDTATRLQVDLRETLTGLRRDARRIEASLARHSDEDLRRHDAEVAERQRDVVVRRDAAVNAARASFDQRRRDAVDALHAAVAAIAPGAASLPWSEPMPARSSIPAAHVRFGTTQIGVPAVAPFLERAGWMLRGHEPVAVDLIRQVVLRAAAQIPLRFLRIRVYDPRIEGPLGWLTELRDAHPASYPQPAHTPDDLRAVLADVTGFASAAAEQISARHVRTLSELWLDEGRPVHPYTLVVVFAYPLGIDPATNSALVRLAESGSPRGVSLLVHHDESVRPERDVDPQDLLRHLTPFENADGCWRTPLLPDEVVVTADAPPDRNAVKDVLSRAVLEVSSDTGPTVPLADLLAPFTANPWQDRVDDGIEAVIGLRGRDPVRLALRSENPPHPNLLIGGAVGQGKSNLLLAIVYSLAARYSPDELEMLLLDFKQGLEFKRFDKDADGRNWLPHARVLSLESSKPFGLAVLNFVQEELDRRAQLFNEARCNGFLAYRATGRPMPRMLLIIDEFHVLFDGTDDVTRDAVSVFERLARQGRAYGIHILLSSQTVSGISGLQVKGDSIFAQFPLRVSLKNTADESQAILARENTAAADLTYRGEVVVNRNYGRADSNEIAVAGYADPVWIGELQKSLWQRAGRPREPWVFLGNDFAVRPTTPPETTTPTALIGRPIAVTDEIVGLALDNDIDQAIAVIGTGDSEAAAVLGGSVESATARWGNGTRIVVLDGRTPAGGVDHVLGVALDRARGRGVEVECVRGDDVPAHLVGPLLNRVREGGEPTLVVALHLQRIGAMDDALAITEEPELDAEPSADPDDVGDEVIWQDDGYVVGATISANEALRELTTRGGAVGVHLLGWWPSLRALSASLDYDHKGVARFVFARAGLEDVRGIASNTFVEAVEGHPRVLVYDRGSSTGLQVVVPFEPLAADR